MSRSFDGSTQYADAASVPVTAAPVTFACWYMVDDLSADRQLALIGNGSGGSNPRIDFYIRGTDDAPATRGVNAAGTARSGVATAAATTGVWQHFTGIEAGTSRAAFLNGGNKGSNSFSLTIDSLTAMRLGRRGTTWHDGLLAEVGVWNVALSDGEVAALGRGVNPRLIRPNALVFYAPLWGTSDPERDYTAGQRHLTLNGSPPVAVHAPVQVMPPSDLWVPPSAAVATDVELGLVQETDTAQAMTVTKDVRLGQPQEIDTAQPMALAKAVTLGLSEEIDTAQPLAVNPQVRLGLVEEIDTALPATLAKTITLGIAEEIDQALPLTVEVEGAVPAVPTLPITHAGQ
jgi:hypothetical protein